MDISLVATTYNDQDSICDFLDSVCGQTVMPSEIIIADGGSTDSTIERIREYGNDHQTSINVVTNGRLNIAQGYNAAVKAAKGEYILITGVGNKYDTGFLEKLANKIKEDNADLVYGKTKGQSRNLFSGIYNKAFLCGKLGANMGIPSNRGCLITKSTFDKIGFFNEGFIYAGEDTEFYRRAQKELSISYCDDAVLYWETPASFKEYLVQKNNYFIGRMQHTGRILSKSEGRNIIIVLLALILSLLLRQLKLTIVVALLVYFYYAAKRRTLNLLAIFLYIYDSFYSLYLVLKYRKRAVDRIV